MYLAHVHVTYCLDQYHIHRVNTDSLGFSYGTIITQIWATLLMRPCPENFLKQAETAPKSTTKTWVNRQL